MECPSCGAAVRDPEAVFCARCGNSLRDDAASTGEAPTVDAGVGGAAPPEQGVTPSPDPPPSYDPGPAPLPAEPPPEGAVTAQQRPGPPDRPSIESPIGGYQGGPVPPASGTRRPFTGSGWPRDGSDHGASHFQ